ncbi:MAG: thioredoxin domain-containing protein [Candidatus Riflebacteria bacterium]|nr:thioredoxin domain-containing protein [Candidatus Riflebacteria bacterium]
MSRDPKPGRRSPGAAPAPEAQPRQNRLATEKSLYLRQHAANPVDWYPWGDEAFARARAEDRPILLSIGYSSCHWCHVMERESFEDPEIADVMNRHFVSIKVDREERPDVDQIYLAALHAVGQEGGWPLNVFLTPDLKPFFGGTYFPPEDRFGRPGFRRVLESIAQSWKEDREKVLQGATALCDALGRVSGQTGSGTVDRSLITAFFEDAVSAFDGAHGGFGGPPKFPRSVVLNLLLRHWRASGEDMARKMVETTLDRMARGGIYDHVGGGFHRYSTDGRWLAPHFEKMLYDNALLAMTYLEAYQATGREGYKRVAREILDWALKDMSHPDGAFYSATDADSEGHEGLFFLWTPAQVEDVLGREAGRAFSMYYNASPDGDLDGASILHVTRSLDDVADELRMGSDKLSALLTEARGKMYAAREKRVHPSRDEKIVTAWVSLTVQALARAAQTLDEPRYQTAALAAGRFLMKEMVDGDQVYRRWIDGQRAHPGVLEDYACLGNALVDLYQLSFDPTWLEHARRVVDAMVARFWDEEAGGFFFAQARPDLLVPIKDAYDGATPSGNSEAALVLARLGTLTSDHRMTDRARKTVQAFAASMRRAPFAHPPTC